MTDMAFTTDIEWTDATWNPVTGCTKVSPGCKNCYAERSAFRLRAMRNPRCARGFQLTLHHDQLRLPLGWKKPRRIFVNSMSDPFHKDIPDDFICSVFEVTVRHTGTSSRSLRSGPKGWQSRTSSAVARERVAGRVHRELGVRLAC